MRRSLKGSKWIERGDLSMKTVKFDQLCAVITVKLSPRTKEKSNATNFLPIPIKYYKRLQWVFDFKKVKALLPFEIYCIKVVFKSHIYSIQL